MNTLRHIRNISYTSKALVFLLVCFAVLAGCATFQPVSEESFFWKQSWKSFTLSWQLDAELSEDQIGELTGTIKIILSGEINSSEHIFTPDAGFAEFSLPENIAEQASFFYIEENGKEIPIGILELDIDSEPPMPADNISYDIENNTMLVNWQNNDAEWMFFRFSSDQSEEEIRVAAADESFSLSLDTVLQYEYLQIEFADEFGNSVAGDREVLSLLLPLDRYKPDTTRYYPVWEQGIARNGKLVNISACAGVLDGLIALADAEQGKILLLDKKGKLIAEQLTGELSVSPFMVPRDICAFSDELFLVADLDGSRIVFLDRTLTVRKSFSVQAPDDDFKAVPQSVFYAGNRIYVADKANNVVKQFNSAGRIENLIGKNLLKAPSGLAVFSDGRLAVSDTVLSALFVFSSEGRLTERWGGFGPKAGKLLNPEKIVIYNDTLYVLDRGKAEIHVFSDDRKDLGDIFRNVVDSKALSSPDSFAALDDGILLAADSRSKKLRLYVDGMQLYNEINIFQPEIDFFTALPADMAVNSTHLYLLDSKRQNVLVLDRFSGEFLFSLPSGNGPGRFYELRGICTGGSGELYVADSLLNSIVIYDEEGSFERRLDLLYISDLGFLPGKIAWKNGRLLISALNSNEVYILDLADVQNNEPVSPELFISGVDNPDGVINSIGSWSDFIYLSEKTKGRLMMYDQNGLLVQKSGGFDSGATLSSPRSLAVDSLGFLYIPVPSERRIRKYSQTDELIGALHFVSSVSGSGQGIDIPLNQLRDSLFFPEQVCIAADGYLYIADAGRKKIFCCRPVPELIDR